MQYSVGRKTFTPVRLQIPLVFSTTAFILFEHIVKLTVYYVTRQHKKVRFNNIIIIYIYNTYTAVVCFCTSGQYFS